MAEPDGGGEIGSGEETCRCRNSFSTPVDAIRELAESAYELAESAYGVAATTLEAPVTYIQAGIRGYLARKHSRQGPQKTNATKHSKLEAAQLFISPSVGLELRVRTSAEEAEVHLRQTLFRKY